MLVSIVVCTYNRAGLLSRLLDSLRRELEGIDGEVVVVDNGSSDDTAAVVEREAAGAVAPIRYVSELQPGLSHARNRGVREARGEILVFIDDDALPEPGWLAAHLMPYATDIRIGTVGGPIELLFEPPDARPRWLSARFEGTLGRYGLGPEPKEYDDRLETPSGGNMSFRRPALEDVGSFDTGLGRVGDAFRSGEEFELAHRLFDRGWRGAYEPGARVLHVIDSERLRLRYFRRRFLWNWRSSEQLARLGFGGSRVSLRQVLASALHDAVGVVTSRNRGDRLYYLLRVESHLRYLPRALRGAAWNRRRGAGRAS